MKKMKIAAAVIMICAAAFMSYNACSISQATLSLNEVEALAAGEGVGVTCRCAGFLGNKQCKASNSKAVCASGDNIQCQNWNGNC